MPSCCSKRTASSAPAAASAGSSPRPSPRIGIERIRPFEEVLGGLGHHVQIKRIQVETQPASEFVAPGVSVEPGNDVWLWESVLIRDGEPIAHPQENISAIPVSFAGGAAAPLEINDDGGTTLLAALNKAAGRGLGLGECQIGLSQVGPSRAKLLATAGGRRKFSQPAALQIAPPVTSTLESAAVTALRLQLRP